jgi:hypothetical protein
LSLAHTSVDYFVDDNGHVLEKSINAIAEEGNHRGVQSSHKRSFLS